MVALKFQAPFFQLFQVLCVLTDFRDNGFVIILGDAG